MSKVKPQSIPIAERKKVIGEFFGLVNNLKTKQEIIDLFIGLLTPSEALMLARRLQIANAIIAEKTFKEIRGDVGVGYGTIATVDKWLYQRSEAYKKVLIKRWPKKNSKNAKVEYYTSELDKYPQHRLLKKLLGL